MKSWSIDIETVVRINTLSYQVNKPDFSVLASTDFFYHSYFFRFALIVLIDEIFMVLFRKYVSLQN